MDLVFVPNATFGVNAALGGLYLGPGDEVLATDHEYGACEHTWGYLAERKGFAYRKACLPLPLDSDQEPVKAICAKARGRRHPWRRSHTTSLGSSFQDDFEYLGTDSYSAYLSVPAAIDFQAEHDWASVRRRCHELLSGALAKINSRTGRAPAYTSADQFEQMTIVETPEVSDLAAFQLALVPSSAHLLGIKRVAQPVAEIVDRQHREEDHQAREEAPPPVALLNHGALGLL